LSSQDLLWRLFNEEGVMAGAPSPVQATCSCSRQRVETVLQGFTAEELAGMHEPDGAVAVTCEYCNRKYRFTPEEAAKLGHRA
jgi:molecular chaperone Hsp33